MKKGFTLVELMGAIIIMGIISLIIIPIVDKNIKSGLEDIYQTQITNMKLSLEGWASDNIQNLPAEGEVVTLTLYQLKQSNHIDFNVINPKTKKPFSNDMLFTITNNNGHIIYNVDDTTGSPTNKTDDDKNMPIINLNGTTLEYVDLGKVYSDKGVIAKKNNGDIISDVEISIIGDGGTIDTNNEGKYNVIYSVSDNGYTAKIIRTVIVKSLNGPTMILPDNNIVYTHEVATFNALNDVSAKDSLGHDVPITVSGSIQDLPMEYTIVYTAIDSSGNKSIKKRIINVRENATKFLQIFTVTSGDGLYADDNMYRYKGVNPNNYIKINNSIFRILSVSDNELKLILQTTLGNNVWDAGNVNDWDKTPSNSNIASDMLTYLNTTYYNNLVTGMGSNNIIKNNSNFYTGKILASSMVLDVAAGQERVSNWNGRVGLMSYTDFIKAQLPASSASCISNTYNNTNCGTNNWLKPTATEWIITGSGSSTSQCYYVNTSGGTYPANCNNSYATRPVITISNEVTLIGSGTSASPYQVKDYRPPISGFDVTKGVNKPQLTEGMTPIKWSGTDWINTTEDDSEWYDYVEKKWANAKTDDDSYWVWIPRYAYKMNGGYHSNTASSFDIKFLKGNTNESVDSTTIETSGYNTDTKTTLNNYFLHPAFQNDMNAYGFWVAKFEPSVANQSDPCYTSASEANCNKTDLTIKITPNVSSLRYMDIGNQFTIAKNMKDNNTYGWNSSKVDTHMMTNVEWGAVAYLTHSTYGKNAEVWKNPSNTFITGCAGTSVNASNSSGCSYAFNTANGQQASTTGNTYGIYDMSGGSWEYVSAYVNSGHSNLTTYGSSIINEADIKYKNGYIISPTETGPNNYSANKNIYGDAIWETSNCGNSNCSWNNDYSYMPFSSLPFFYRGGDYSHDANAGLFFFFGDYGFGSGGGGGYNGSFRPVFALKP